MAEVVEADAAKVALQRSVVKVRVRLVGSIGLPCTVVNTCASCGHVAPAASRSRCCCSWWCFSDWTQRAAGRAMRRSEARVLVGSVVSPPALVRWSVRRMAAVPA
jgi:hypothetical protein